MSKLAPKLTPEARKARSRLGVAVQRGTPEEEHVARRDFAAIRLQDYVNEVLASFPPLTDEQIDRVVELLRPTAGGAR